jgi:hypothetical protein
MDKERRKQQGEQMRKDHCLHHMANMLLFCGRHSGKFYKEGLPRLKYDGKIPTTGTRA